LRQEESAHCILPALRVTVRYTRSIFREAAC